MRYVEGWGSGFLRMNEELSDYGARPVEIEDAGIATRLNVYRLAANAQSVRHEGNEGNREGNEGNREPNEPNCVPNEPNDPNQDPNEPKDTVQTVLVTLSENPSATIPSLMEVCQVSRETIKRALKTLKDAGLIRRKGGTRGVWEVL